jgi:hypothetical protein
MQIINEEKQMQALLIIAVKIDRCMEMKLQCSTCVWQSYQIQRITNLKTLPHLKNLSVQEK